jgi:predicted PolB exonuclease-like 3'-5' exonuclease
LQSLSRLDEPHFKPRQIVEQFWSGVSRHFEKSKGRVKLVTFNGRGFDLPLLEMAAFRFGCALSRDYGSTMRKRFDAGHFDVMEFMGNYGAVRFGLSQNLLAKLLGKPGKMQVDGRNVYQMHLDGQLAAINDYCMFDTLDLYFVFLRTRVMLGVLSLGDEHQLVMRAKEFLQGRLEQFPGLKQFLDNWGDWNPWP